MFLNSIDLLNYSKGLHYVDLHYAFCNFISKTVESHLKCKLFVEKLKFIVSKFWFVSELFFFQSKCPIVVKLSPLRSFGFSTAFLIF